MTKTNTATKSTAQTTPAVAETPTYTDEQLVAQGLVSLSQRIRHLSAAGLKTGEIAKIVKRSNGEHPRYQHVRNVLMTQLKRPAATPAPSQPAE